MPLFATDFGAGGAVVCCAGVMLLAVMALSAAGIAYGVRLWRRNTRRARRAGAVLIVVCCLLPFVAYRAPAWYTRATLGRWPLERWPSGEIREGMSREEVLQRLGRPNEQYERDGEETWFYYTDSLGADIHGVRFGSDGRVVSTFYI